ncbi:hypothetical protein COY16_05485 [Candidatus Roizmanbacteria bacterium CG_4_10_14_0_2_um_filter_39_13]|uniref:Big-1 domain-containing protein n=1 Tax=Candidatus Roizmanbacteria bacterium CG_4_10_14_0_2_um_filter_39_13 TaxID=1974825 RepID=A0A2M7TW00_9BACT|nr:MAG: hypothetical protein COY16_05485 [Candidatus Roizmanbacteria bacterium CG_4_10_14_0_2_um_filter_39_13]
MKRTALFVGLIFLVSFFALGTQPVFAGGCCFKSYSASNGIAGKQEAEINVSFVDPANPYSDAGKTTLSSLSGQKIDIHIVSPQSGQSCYMKAETTDASGHTEARCSSTTPGQIMVRFTAPNMDAQSQEMIRSVSKPVYFDADPNAQPVIPSNTLVPFVPTATHTVTPQQAEVISPVEASSEGSKDTEKLQKRVQELEQKVADQQKEVSMLTSLMNKLLDFINSLFGK